MSIFTNIKESRFIRGVRTVTFKDFASGRIFIKDFILRQSKLLVLIILLTFTYMDNRMLCERSLSEIDKLNKELTTIRYVSMITESELLKAGRQAEIEKLLNEKGLDLVNLEKPAYKLKIDE